MHIREVYTDGELLEPATCKECLQVQNEGGRALRRQRRHYNLDLILAVGYRIRSDRGTQFRQSATKRLREYYTAPLKVDATIKAYLIYLCSV